MQEESQGTVQQPTTQKELTQSWIRQSNMIALVVILVFLAFMLWMFRGLFFGASAQLEVDKRVHAFIIGACQGKFDRAYQIMLPSYRRRVDLGKFRAAIEASGWFTSALQEFSRRQSDALDDTVRVTGVLREDRGEIAVVFHLTKWNDKWFITEVVVGGTPVLANK